MAFVDKISLSKDRPQLTSAHFFLFSLIAIMFKYTPVSDAVQCKHRVRDIGRYVRVFYQDPDPILKGYTHVPCMLTEKFAGFAQEIKDFQVRPDDIYIMSYPKTGTTLMSELVTAILCEMDFEELEKSPLLLRSPFLE